MSDDLSKYNLSNFEGFWKDPYNKVGLIIVPCGDLSQHYLIVSLDFNSHNDLANSQCQLGRIYSAFMVKVCPPQDLGTQQLRGCLWVQKISLDFLSLQLIFTEGTQKKIEVILDKNFFCIGALVLLKIIPISDFEWQYGLPEEKEFRFFGRFYLSNEAKSINDQFFSPPAVDNGVYRLIYPYCFFAQSDFAVNYTDSI